MINEINAKQLFLLCALRVNPVRAKNLASYFWTMEQHTSYCSIFNKELREKFPNRDHTQKDYENLRIDVVKRVRKDLPEVQEPKFREFIAYSGQMGYDLTDRGEDMAWYSGSSRGWGYDGMFEIEHPLSKKEELSGVAKDLAAMLRKDFSVEYDETQSIGKRYRRQDEIGTPYCVTVDFESLEDKKVTVRDRDTMVQERISIEELKGYLQSKFEN